MPARDPDGDQVSAAPCGMVTATAGSAATSREGLTAVRAQLLGVVSASERIAAARVSTSIAWAPPGPSMDAARGADEAVRAAATPPVATAWSAKTRPVVAKLNAGSSARSPRTPRPPATTQKPGVTYATGW